jgi:hypothetical protein
MRWVLVLLGEKVLWVFRYGGCSVTSGWTLVLSETGFPLNAAATKCAPHGEQGL